MFDIDIEITPMSRTVWLFTAFYFINELFLLLILILKLIIFKNEEYMKYLTKKKNEN